MSMGTGNTIVLLFSADMLFSVCRYLNYKKNSKDDDEDDDDDANSDDDGGNNGSVVLCSNILAYIPGPLFLPSQPS